MRFTAWFCVAIPLILLPVLPQVTPALPDDKPSLQRFVCNTGYTLEKCREDITVLQRTLAKYPTAELGNWTWVLVRSEDWKAILLPRGLDPDSPAFTFCSKRETFIEEALVTKVPVRSRELLLKWNMGMRDLLDFAIAHELGHALCNDKDEWNANRVGQLLRNGRVPTCGTAAGRQAGEPRLATSSGIESGDSEVPFTIADGYLIIVEVRIGELRRVKFALDTGATYSVLRAIPGKGLENARQPVRVFNLERVLAQERVNVADFQLGPIRIPQLAMMRNGLQYLRTSAPGWKD